jgi:hypothetical protein
MINREEQELWRQYIEAFNDFDPNWFYDNNPAEHQELNKRRETAIARIAQDLKLKGWDSEKYYRVKVKSLSKDPLDHDEVVWLIENPSTGHEKGWRNDEAEE